MRSDSIHSASSSWFDGHGLEIVGAIEVGRAVDVAARRRASSSLKCASARHVLRALEHHVLEQVREAGAARHLVGRADVVPDIHRDERQPMILRRGSLRGRSAASTSGTAGAECPAP